MEERRERRAAGRLAAAAAAATSAQSWSATVTVSAPHPSTLHSLSLIRHPPSDCHSTPPSAAGIRMEQPQRSGAADRSEFEWLWSPQPVVVHLSRRPSSRYPHALHLGHSNGSTRRSQEGTQTVGQRRPERMDWGRVESSGSLILLLGGWGQTPGLHKMNLTRTTSTIRSDRSSKK